MPTAPENSLAVVDSNGKVVTFVRADVPSGWTPPVGHTAVPSNALPEGWEYQEAPPAPVPTTVTRRQLHLWLLDENVTSADILTAIAAIEDAAERARAQVEYETAINFERDHPLINQLGTALGFSLEEIDEGFRIAHNK